MVFYLRHTLQKIVLRCLLWEIIILISLAYQLNKNTTLNLNIQICVFIHNLWNIKCKVKVKKDLYFFLYLVVK